MRFENWLRLTAMFAYLTLFLALPLPMFDQNCALCYTQRASSGARMIQALKSGILVLVIPPILGSTGMIFLVRRRSNQFRVDDSEDPRQDW